LVVATIQHCNVQKALKRMALRLSAGKIPEISRSAMTEQPDKNHDSRVTPNGSKRKRISIATRNLLMIVVGLVVFAAVSGIVLYGPLMYGDMIPNFGIILILTVPIIAGVAFRVGIDAWLDRE
jgi:hypothetical protein